MDALISLRAAERYEVQSYVVNNTSRPWRQGFRIPHHIYEQQGDEPDRRPWPHGDRPVATFFDPEDAKRAVDAHNYVLEQEA